jgi:hypothetical protein
MGFTGFPGGKTKTIALDLQGLLNPDDPRIQLRTSMQFAWDHIFFSLNESPAEVRERPLDLLSANLHERGFSERIPPVHNGPELFDYANVSRQMKYLPLTGRFTRFGDVTPLLTGWDDRMVVMGPGDEMTLEFAAPQDSLPEGWTRDFILYNVGWDKDAQMQTVYGMSSEPLPFKEMSGYPYTEDYPQTQELQDYIETYQTREFKDGNFRRQMKPVAR